MIRWTFHWRFWRPRRDVVGGPVWFGWIADVEAHGQRVQMTPLQVQIKRDMGLIR